MNISQMVIPMKINKQNTKTTKKKSSTSKKVGDSLEKRIQFKCEQLYEQGISCINKVPTEFTILRNGARIVSAFPVKASKFVDFTGYIKGVGHVDIEAKSCANKTSFPLSNILDTEYEYLSFMLHRMNNPYEYYIIEMREYKEIYLIKAIDVETFKNTETRKSLPYQWIKDNGILLEDLNFIDYIKQ